MHKNPLWLAFLASIAVVVFWFTFSLGAELLTYWSLDKTTTPREIVWSVNAKSSDRFYLKAAYQYQVNAKSYHGETSFDKTTYRTPRAADQILLEEKNKERTVWYSSNDPSVSGLQKIFPLKSFFYTAILWGLLLYFGGLSLYVERFNFPKAGG